MDGGATPERRITIAVLALGGQGGGVLANWIREMAAHEGHAVQATSIPGVAQRTGSTVYYIEILPQTVGGDGAQPVLALMPAPGDVDIVIASELMEAGRAMVRGLVSSDRTTLVTSTHRVYAISEKAVVGDGRASSAVIIDKARSRARRLVAFDMEAAAGRSGSVISSVMLGALAGSGALPFERKAFENAIRRGGKAISSNLAGFAAGFERATTSEPEAKAPEATSEPTTSAGRILAARIAERLPPAAQDIAREGVRRLLDYQDLAYAETYLSRLEDIAAVEDGGNTPSLTATVARWLALWMAYEDIIRVADLKTRVTRGVRIAEDVRLEPGQVMAVTDYMHPRLQELCDVAPRGLAAALLGSAGLRRRLEPLFSKGFHVQSSRLSWFLALSAIAGLRPIRRASFRFAVEQARIDAWLSQVRAAAVSDAPLALELAASARLLKGYGDTFERGLARFEAILAAARHAAPSTAFRIVQQMREAALRDDKPDIQVPGQQIIGAA